VNYYFDDFTENEYRKLLRIAEANWTLICYADYKKPGKVCLWRHDLDLSVHRGYRLAQIEAEEGIKATYFVHLHSRFYNPLECEVADLILAICNLGHDLGLHFDPIFYASRLKCDDDLQAFLKFEQQFLAETFQTDIQVFSVHNPDVGNSLKLDQDEIAGMINIYGGYFKQHYGYCSDANGYWRFRRLRDVLEAAEDEKLHVLTHPGWWVPEPMSPRARVARCIEGRGAKTAMRYDQSLAGAGRENIR
jgi:hypothetical protein